MEQEHSEYHISLTRKFDFHLKTKQTKTKTTTNQPNKQAIQIPICSRTFVRQTYSVPTPGEKGLHTCNLCALPIATNLAFLRLPSRLLQLHLIPLRCEYNVSRVTNGDADLHLWLDEFCVTKIFCPLNGHSECALEQRWTRLVIYICIYIYIEKPLLLLLVLLFCIWCRTQTLSFALDFPVLYSAWTFKMRISSQVLLYSIQRETWVPHINYKFMCIRDSQSKSTQ